MTDAILTFCLICPLFLLVPAVLEIDHVDKG